jgi:tripartite-type tricarboxylate transporter receptor subunit TctC
MSEGKRVTASALSLMIASLLLVGCAVQTTSGGQESAEDYPDRAIDLIVPFSAGGSTDLAARQVALIAEPLLGQSINVVNRGGGGGAVGHAEVLGARPDGYTIGMGSSDSLTATPHITDVDYSIDDFKGYTGVYAAPFLMMANAESPYQTTADLIEAGRNGRVITYGYSGTTFQLAQADLFNQAGIEATGVPFEGGAQAKTALLGNEVDAAGQGVEVAASQVEAGETRALGAFTSERLEVLPDVPTFQEQGFDVVGQPTKKFIVAPKDTPDEIVDVLNEKFSEAVESQEYQEYLVEQGLLPTVSGEEAIRALEEEYERNGRLIEELGPENIHTE